MKQSFQSPQIVIKYSPQLDQVFLGYTRVYSQHKEKWQAWEPWTREEIEKHINAYRAEWRKYETQILEKICNVTGLRFKKNVIPVYIVITSFRNFADPIVIRATETPEKFVAILAHELIHELCPWSEDGGVSDSEYFKIIKEIFPDEHDNIVIAHCFVYVVLETIFKAIPKGEGLWDITKKQASGDTRYHRALQIVLEQGSDVLVEKFKSLILANKNPSLS